MIRFYLGIHIVNWIGYIGIPTFVSLRRLRLYNQHPYPSTNWALDSGGFTELNMFGKWTITTKDYAKYVADYHSRLPKMDFAATQDWMCEPEVLAKTKLTVEEHQKRTIDNYLELKSINSKIPWLPVIQGYTIKEYTNCVEMYDKANVDMTQLFGLGSICRRQQMNEAYHILKTFNLRLHGFGFKLDGLLMCREFLESSDSMAWCKAASKRPPLPGCNHKTCNNCMKFAKSYYERVIKSCLSKNN